MSKVVIVADDLTGANATSVLLVRQGFKATTFLDIEKFRVGSSGDIDVISISTDSRGLNDNAAYLKVQKIMKKMAEEDVVLFSKRIDSTLRGNVGKEMSAMLDSLPDHIAIVVASFPASGRVCIGGYLLVNQIPLQNTDVGKDPKTPVRHSKVETIIREQYEGEIGSIHLNCVLKGPAAIQEDIKALSEKGIKAIIIDATTDEDIINIAKAVKDSGIPAIAVDPGPFTAALSKELMEQPKLAPGKKILFSIGSVSNLTRRQIETLSLKYEPIVYHVDTMNLLSEEGLEKECEKTLKVLIKSEKEAEILGITTTSNEDEVLNLTNIAKQFNTTEDEISTRIANGLAKITHKVLEQGGDEIGGLYTSGGDVTVAVCKELGSSGIKVKDEVLPLAVYGRIFEGDYNNYPIITKGGLVGNDNALVECVEYLLTKISTEYFES